MLRLSARAFSNVVVVPRGTTSTAKLQLRLRKISHKACHKVLCEDSDNRLRTRSPVGVVRLWVVLILHT